MEGMIIDIDNCFFNLEGCRGFLKPFADSIYRESLEESKCLMMSKVGKCFGVRPLAIRAFLTGA